MPFDPDTVAALGFRAKGELRKRMRAVRMALPASAIEERSQRIAATVAESAPFRRSMRIALFAPILARHEVDLRPLDRLARERGKAVFYPRLEAEPGSMSLREAKLEDLVELGHGFAEPPEKAAAAEAGDDLLIVVPALAVAPDGHRIGYGMGFYDRLLARMAPPATSLAVAFHFQLLAEIPATTLDRPVSWIVTDAALLEAEPARASSNP